MWQKAVSLDLRGRRHDGPLWKWVWMKLKYEPKPVFLWGNFVHTCQGSAGWSEDNLWKLSWFSFYYVGLGGWTLNLELSSKHPYSLSCLTSALLKLLKWYFSLLSVTVVNTMTVSGSKGFLWLPLQYQVHPWGKSEHKLKHCERGLFSWLMISSRQLLLLLFFLLLIIIIIIIIYF